MEFLKYSRINNLSNEDLVNRINTTGPLTVVKQLNFGDKNITFIEKAPGSVRRMGDFIENTYCKFRNNKENGKLVDCPAKAMGLCGGMIKDGKVSRALLADGESMDVESFIDETVNTGGYMLCNPAYTTFSGKVGMAYTKNPNRVLLGND